MASPFRLQEFKSDATAQEPPAASTGAAQPAISPEALEQARLAGYEAGYQAGWDDAVRTEKDEQNRIGAEFARNLQDLGFTFHEARSHVMATLEPLLTGMVEKVLPEMVSKTIGQSIVEQLLPLASEAVDIPIEVMVRPSCRPTLEPFLAASTSVPFSLVEEPSLAEGQVFLRAGSLEKHLDFSGAVDRIGAAITDLFSLNERAFQNERA